jgi:hypothetical protein
MYRPQGGAAICGVGAGTAVIGSTGAGSEVIGGGAGGMVGEMFS